MTKYFLILVFSYPIISADFANEQAENLASLRNFLSHLEGDHTLSLDELDSLSAKNRKRKLEECDENRDPNELVVPLDKKQKKSANKSNQPIIIARNSPDLEYIDIDQEILKASLLALDQIKLKKSLTRSYAIYNEEMRASAYEAAQSNELAPFLPLVREIILAVSKAAQNRDKSALHIAFRVDSDGNHMKRDFERKLTMEWHCHRGTEDSDGDRYLFALTKNDTLTTMIKHEDKEKFIEKNRIFFLPAEMSHRTPDSAPGKRIQMSISIGNLPDQD